MHDTTARKPVTLSDTQQFNRESGNLISNKIWLPKLLYDVLPYFYLISGIAAFFATLYISEWFWVLPHYLLFSAACIHFGIALLRRRHKSQQSSEQNQQES